MRQILSLILILCLTTLAFAPFIQAQISNELRVNEQATKLLWRENSTEVWLIAENSGGAMPAKVKLELVAPDGKSSIPPTEKSFALKNRRNELKIPLSVVPASFQQTDLVWHRLRYEVVAGNAKTAGMIAVSEIAPEVFELKVAAADYFRAPMRYRAQVQAAHPVSGVGIAHVKLKGEFHIELDTEQDEDEITLNAKAETDAEGFATLDFQIPENINIDGI
jgi:hypothetical protein